MTQIELTDGSLFISTDNREELLTIIAYISKHYERLQTRNQKAVTVYESFDIELPPMVGKDKL
jgi:hypothetical protein